MSRRIDNEILSRLTTIETLLKGLTHTQSDHEDRIRVLENKPVVTPRHIYGGVTLACLLLGTVAAIITVFIRGLAT